ncbi:SIS domain-containing protein [Vagococcus acidifermentans]|uniref:SIS domain-containing protein n=1 Tax=Vagococcus acidifermentans TaxID=564710 RepID=A0A430AMD5_9ENTE|nr:SIS domain-containing protein [Vagococcus acidifermentans]RSU09113.1 hypothetical protein CBF27_13500 [Vagococcus acidifermentans]
MTIDDDDLILYYGEKVTPSDTVIFISLSGETACLVKAADLVKNNRAKIIVLTSNDTSPLYYTADFGLLSYKSPIKKLSTTLETASRFSLEMNARILSDSYIVYSELRSIKRLTH